MSTNSTRQKQVSVEQFLKAAKVAALCKREGKIDNKGITAQIGEELGLTVEDTEGRYKRFAAQKKYKPVFEKIEAACGGVEFATVGKPGRRGVSDETLDAFAADFDAMMDDDNA